jgi:stage IV sporulation protein FB
MLGSERRIRRRGRIRIRLHPLFVVVLAAAVAGHFLALFVVLFAVVILHELGHAAAARALGYSIEEIELLPFGGVAKLAAGNIGFCARHETLIAISGPLVNLVLILLTSIWRMAPFGLSDWSQMFLTVNLTILFFNLLPGLPLDGGRIARAGLAQSRGYEPATRTVTTMSFYLAAALMFTGSAALWLGYPDAGLLALGLFLLFSAYTLRRQSRYDTLRFLDAKRRERPAGALPVRQIAVAGDTTVGEVAAMFAPGSYHVVCVRDAEGRLGERESAREERSIEEADLLAAVFERGMWTEPVWRLLPRSPL